MAQIVAPGGLQTMQDVENAFADQAVQINSAIENPVLPAYTVATVPRAVNPNIIIVVTNASTGRTVCLSNGTAWIDLQTGVAVV